MPDKNSQPADNHSHPKAPLSNAKQILLIVLTAIGATALLLGAVYIGGIYLLICGYTRSGCFFDKLEIPKLTTTQPLFSEPATPAPVETRIKLAQSTSEHAVVGRSAYLIKSSPTEIIAFWPRPDGTYLQQELPSGPTQKGLWRFLYKGTISNQLWDADPDLVEFCTSASEGSTWNCSAVSEYQSDVYAFGPDLGPKIFGNTALKWDMSQSCPVAENLHLYRPQIEDCPPTARARYFNYY